MKKQSIASLLIAGVLSACGGGGGGQPAAQPVISLPVSYTAAQPTLKDFQSYNVTWQNTVTDGKSTGGKYGRTEVMAILNKDGSYAKALISDDNGSRQYTYFGPDGSVTAEDGTCQYVFTPAYIETPATLTVGKSWESNTVRTCSDVTGKDTPISVKGSAVAIETLTVPAGTFTAIKTVFQVTFRFKSSTAVQDATCWRDTVTGYKLKCEITSIYTRNDTGVVSRKEIYSEELTGYSHAATGKKQLNVARFGGNWQIWYTGQQSGICSVSIDTAGIVTGTCYDNFYSNFNIVGTVDAEGVGKFSLNQNATMFTGNFESPLKISGNWTFMGSSGTWYMLHL